MLQPEDDRGNCKFREDPGRSARPSNRVLIGTDRPYIAGVEHEGQQPEQCNLNPNLPREVLMPGFHSVVNDHECRQTKLS